LKESPNLADKKHLWLYLISAFYDEGTILMQTLEALLEIPDFGIKQNKS
jgi:hypothetical protein